jgi:hypothetical protein
VLHLFYMNKFIWNTPVSFRIVHSIVIFACRNHETAGLNSRKSDREPDREP